MNYKKIIVSALTVTSMLLSTMSFPVSADTTNPWGEEKASEDTFRFGFLTDVHIAPSDSTGVAQYMKMGLDAYDAMGVDGLALPGDIVASQLGHNAETIESDLYAGLQPLLDEYGYEIKSDDPDKRVNDENKKPLVYGMGNHEMASNHQNPTGIWAAKDLFVTANGIDDLSTVRITDDGKYTGDYVTEMGGYTFIVSSANCGLFDAANTPSAANGVGVDIESWVKEQIEAATTAYNGANKPIFYVQHIPAQSHTGMTSYKTNSDEFMEWLKDYPNVIILSGHTHELINDPRVISQDAGYTSIVSGVMATGNASVLGASVDSTLVSGGPSGIKQSMAIDATYDETNNKTDIKVYRLDIQNQEFIGEPFEFTIDGNAQTKYSIADRFADEGKSTAKWNDGTSVTATAVEGTRNIKVSFATGATVTPGTSADVLQDDFVWAYKAFAVNNATGKADKVSTRAAEFYKDTETATRSFTFSDLARDQEYTIKMYPLTVFQQKMTYAELDDAGVVANTATVKTNNIKTASEIAQQMTRNAFVSDSKPVSFIQNDGTTTALTDGDINTFVEELWDTQTQGVGFIVDLEKSYKVTDVNLEAVNGNDSGRSELIIYGSNDKENWTQIFERTSADIGDDFGTKATDYLNCSVNSDYYRYVKVRYPFYAILREIKVYADIPVTNVAYGATVEASDTILSYVSSFPLKNAVDGNNATAIASTYDTDYYHYLQLDLGKKYPIAMIEYHKKTDNDDTNAKSWWNAYGSNSVSDRATLQTKNALDTSVYTKLTTGTNKYFDETVDVITEKLTGQNEYQYVTVRKENDSAFMMGEFRVFVENPAVAEFNYNDGTAKITFTEAMDLTNINENITVYNSNGTAKAVTFTPNADNTVVTFAAESGDKVVVSQNITNTLGFGMHEDESYDVIDLSIDYSGKTTKKFENVNVAYGKAVTSPTGYVSDIPAPDVYPDYYNESQLTNGVQHGFVSASGDEFVIDLGRGYNLNKIVLKMHTNDVYTTQASIHYTLSGSADGENWTPIAQATGVADEAIWNGKVGTHNITEDVNYRYIKYSHPYYFILEEIEAYADVEATQVTKNDPNSVTSSSASLQSLNGLLVDDWPNLTYVDGAGYNWISVEMDNAYPIGMYELYVRDWNESGSHGMDGWRNVHGVKLYGSNEAPVEQIDENTTNLSVADLTPYGFDVLGDTRSFEPWQALFSEAYPPVQEFTTDSFDKSSLMPEGWIFTDVYRETVNNTTRYKNLTLKKYDNVNRNMEYGEFAAYVLNATVNAVDADNTGVDIHFGDKMVANLLNEGTVTLKKDGATVGYTGELTDNGLVYTMDAALEDGDYTLTVSKDVKNILGVPMQADFSYDFTVGEDVEYGIKTVDGADVSALAASTEYVVTEPVSGANARLAIVAIYDANDMLIASSVENIPADYAKEYAEISITTPETLADGAKVRYFLWETNTFKPVIESIKVFE